MYSKNILNKTKYVKLVYSDNKDVLHALQANIGALEEKCIVLQVSSDSDIVDVSSKGVEVSFICNEGMYKAESYIISIKRDIKKIYVLLEWPGELKFCQSREYFRVKGDCECKFTPINSNLSEIATKTIDISAKGISIFLKRYYSDIKDIKLDIMLNRVVTTGAKFVRSEEYEDGYKYSFVYTDMAERDRDVVAQYCIKMQIQQRQKEQK